MAPNPAKPPKPSPNNPTSVREPDNTRPPSEPTPRQPAPVESGGEQAGDGSPAVDAGGQQEG